MDRSLDVTLRCPPEGEHCGEQHRIEMWCYVLVESKLEIVSSIPWLFDDHAPRRLEIVGEAHCRAARGTWIDCCRGILAYLSPSGKPADPECGPAGRSYRAGHSARHTESLSEGELTSRSHHSLRHG